MTRAHMTHKHITEEKVIMSIFDKSTPGPVMPQKQQEAGMNSDLRIYDSNSNVVAYALNRDFLDVGANAKRIAWSYNYASKLLDSLQILLAESTSWTTERCSNNCESYGQGTDGEKQARELVEKARNNLNALT